MNKNDLSEKVAHDYDLTKTLARDIVDNIFDAVIDTIKAGSEVVITGLGTFKVGQRASRKGRNPSTGEIMMIPSSRVVQYRQAGLLKAALNEAPPTPTKAPAKGSAKSAAKSGTKSAEKAPAKTAAKTAAKATTAAGPKAAAKAPAKAARKKA